MRYKIFIFLFFILNFTFFTTCKQLPEDYYKDNGLVVRIYGTVTPPSSWEHPKIIAVYSKDLEIRKYDTAIIGSINDDGSWEVFVEKNTEVSIYIFNDINNNGSFDYKVEPRVPYQKNPISVKEEDVETEDLIIRKITGKFYYPTEFWKNPKAFLMKGWDIYGYSDIDSNNNFTLYGGYGDDYKVYFFNDNGDGYYDYNTEKSYEYSGNPIDLTSQDAEITYTLRAVYGTISNIPSFFKNPILALVYPNSSCWAVIASYGEIKDDGSFVIISEPLSQFRLWIISDIDGNGTYDYNRDPYAQVPERGSTDLCSDTSLSSASGDVQIDVTMGVLSGTLDTSSATYTYPQAGLMQGWDVTAYNPLDSTSFQFGVVKDYSVNGGTATTESYYILVFDDDNTHDGVYVYANENDEVTTSGPYTADNTSISITVP